MRDGKEVAAQDLKVRQNIRPKKQRVLNGGILNGGILKGTGLASI
jgi:hypothetical protein